MNRTILIADSGSTKTRWALANDPDTVAVTPGLNPRLTPETDVPAAVRHMLADLPAAAEAREVWFYGAGCGTDDMQARVAEWLHADLPAATIHASDDLLGACRATCGHDAGLVGILGTGSNLCHYDGTLIDRQWTSTGYLLGDEGSGNHIGRRLLKDYLEGTMPDALAALFHADYPMSHAEFLLHLYQQPYPNRFLASLAPFAARHRGNAYVDTLLAECFDAFLAQVARHGLPAASPLHLVGGLTAPFAPDLTLAARRAHLTLATLTPDPLPDLLRFHAEEYQCGTQ